MTEIGLDMQALSNNGTDKKADRDLILGQVMEKRTSQSKQSSKSQFLANTLTINCILY